MSFEDDHFRFSVFAENYRIVQEHNAKGLSYWLTLNKFAALTHQEFKDMYANGIPEDETAIDRYCPSAQVACPTYPVSNLASLNWTAKGAVTPVKDQGQCGSCWAFSATGTLESLDFIMNGRLNSYSEQQLVDCDTGCYGCSGCWVYAALDYTAKYGVESESSYPYNATENTCQYSSSKATKTNAGWNCVAQKNVQDLKGAASQQPVGIAVQADEAAWQFYGGGVVSSGCGDALNHAVLLTGWANIGGTNAWLVKNSWGSDWGNGGYIYISQAVSKKETYGVCGILRCPVVPTY